MARLRDSWRRNLTASLDLGNPAPESIRRSPYDYFLRTTEALAPSLAIELVPSPTKTAADIERAIESFARVPNGGLVLPPDAMTAIHRDLIIALAARHRLPAVSSARFWVVAGG